MVIKLFYQGNLLDETKWQRREFNYAKQLIEGLGFSYVLTENDYDILHLNTTGLKSYLVLKKALKKKKKIIFQIHDDIYAHARWGVLTGFIYGIIINRQRRWARKCDLIIVNKASTKCLLEEDKKLKGKNIMLIKRGLREINFNIPELYKLAFKRYFQIKDNEKVIVGSGNISWQKGYYDFVRVAKKLPFYKFIWFCPKPSVLDLENRNYLKDLPNNMVISHFTSQECFLGAFGSADLFLLPYYEEESSNTILKAMASARTVIVRNAHLKCEFVHGVHYYKGNSVDDFCWLITHYFEGKLEKTGINAQKMVKENYSFTNRLTKYKNVYESLVNK